MLKMIMSDYVVNFKTSWKRYAKRKNVNKLNLGMTLFNIFIWIPWIITEGGKNLQYIRLGCWGQFLFVMMGWYLMELYPNSLEKSMFLCPMTRKERRHYLVTAYGLRIFLLVIPYLCLEIICGYFYKLDISFSILKTFSFLLLMMSGNLYLDDEAVYLECQRESSRLWGYKFWRGCANVIGLLTIITMVMISTDEHMISEIWMRISVIGISMQIIVSVIYLAVFFSRVMEVAQDYERNYR